ncbi:MAG: glycoside hydrolase family 99-like domain-containing protein [Deltaproteobacteria bacterium]|nr:glycoside hydrolase family 99-like domain-containing protein [Deltaproteobacteria bacterium]
MLRIIQNLKRIISTYDFRKTVSNIRTYGLKMFLKNVFLEITKSSPGFKSSGGYFDFLFEMNNLRDKEYAPESFPDIQGTDIKLIAFYLPQFHPIQENDQWWGKGFTEWTNVTKAVPQFIGHYQPKLPGELGFYDLRNPEIQNRQIELAKQYGIFGFCFHFYWFNGKRLLDMPIEQFFANRDANFPFCISWANENWTRRWDGKDKEILLAQNYSPEDDMAFIEYVSRYLKDDRYIRINSKPLLSVYRPALLPDPKATAERWRQWCRKNGIGEIYLVVAHSFERIDPSEIGFDAAIEFAPNSVTLMDITSRFEIVNEKYQGRILNYESAKDAARDYRRPSYKKFRGICPGWDNEARRRGSGITLANSSPAAYKEWLEILCDFTVRNFASEERMIFINAWNEWAEGAYLEPDRRYGYAYLQAGADALRAMNIRFSKENRQADAACPFGEVKKHHDTAVILHLYYPELWEEISDYLENLDGEFDLYVSIPYDVNFQPERILAKHQHANIYQCANRGRDIAPFLTIFSAIYPLQYKHILKIHTKRSQHRKDGDIWRQNLLSNLLGSRELVSQIKKILDSQDDVGIVAPRGHMLPSSFYWGKNADKVKRLAQVSDIPYHGEEFRFVAGSMFWFNPSAFKQVISLHCTLDDFEPEQGQVDGTLSHAIERYFGLLMQSTGFQIVEVGSNEGEEVQSASLGYRFAMPPASKDCDKKGR